MIEQATGYFSGSIYCDSVLKKVFPGEAVASGNVVVIKTHHADARTLPKDVQISAGRERYHKVVLCKFHHAYVCVIPRTLISDRYFVPFCLVTVR